jgi:hypothetical protein
MIAITYRKFVKESLLVAAITALVAPSEVFGLLFELFHFLIEHFIELSYFAFELIESGLDHLIEHLFHTDRHQTQVIVFYTIASFTFYGLYYLWRVVPPFCRRSIEALFLAWPRKKASLFSHWQELSMANKIKLFVIGVVVVNYYIFFSF